MITRTERRTSRAGSGLAALVMLGALLAPGVAAAQKPVQEREKAKPQVSAQFKPPPGMCRIWLEGVPGAKQPAPTDCATALRNRPANGRVLFGEDLPRQRSQPVKRGGRRSGKD